jgi:hypothetical protein
MYDDSSPSNASLLEESILILEDIVNLENQEEQMFANDSFPLNTSLLLPSSPNSSYIPWWEDVPYPGSGYTQLGIVLVAFFITCIMILIVIGNMLVCIAISTEKSLKTVQNWFIASLAVSDLLLGLVIMPFSLAYELMGYWIFGQVWCEVGPLTI